MALDAADDLGRLLLECRVSARVGVVGGRDVVRVRHQERVLGRARREVLEEGLRGVLVGGERRGLGRQHEAVDRGVDAELRSNGAEGREGEEVEVVVVGLGGRLLTRERAEEVHPGLLLYKQVGGVLPRPAELADMSPLNGRSSFQAVNTAAVFGSVHFWAPFISRCGTCTR